MTLIAALHRVSNASLPSQGFWGRFKTPKGGKEMELKQAQQQHPQMALARQRLLTLSFDDMETIRMVSPCPAPSDDTAPDTPYSSPALMLCVLCRRIRFDRFLTPRFRN